MRISGKSQNYVIKEKIDLGVFPKKTVIQPLLLGSHRIQVNAVTIWPAASQYS